MKIIDGKAIIGYPSYPMVLDCIPCDGKLPSGFRLTVGGAVKMPNGYCHADWFKAQVCPTVWEQLQALPPVVCEYDKEISNADR